MKVGEVWKSINETETLDKSRTFNCKHTAGTRFYIFLLSERSVWLLLADENLQNNLKESKKMKFPWIRSHCRHSIPYFLKNFKKVYE